MDQHEIIIGVLGARRPLILLLDIFKGCVLWRICFLLNEAGFPGIHRFLHFHTIKTLTWNALPPIWNALPPLTRLSTRSAVATLELQTAAAPTPKVESKGSGSNGDCAPEKFMAFHPRDHWEFAKDLEHKNAVIYVHGHNYAPNDSSAAEFVLNECLDFYADLPYLVIPFIWPCEGTQSGSCLHRIP